MTCIVFGDIYDRLKKISACGESRTLVLKKNKGKRLMTNSNQIGFVLIYFTAFSTDYI